MGGSFTRPTPEMADGMERLCRKADIVVPNMTEACHLLGKEYDPGPYTRDKVEEILEKLCEMGPKMAVLTGVWLKAGSLGTACFDSRTGRMELFSQTGLTGSITAPEICLLRRCWADCLTA